MILVRLPPKYRHFHHTGIHDLTALGLVVRLTNTFSKKMEKHAVMVNLFFLYYNFCRFHTSLRGTPVMEAGLDTTVRDIHWMAELVRAWAKKPNRPKPGKKKIRQMNFSNEYTTRKPDSGENKRMRW